MLYNPCTEAAEHLYAPAAAQPASGNDHALGTMAPECGKQLLQSNMLAALPDNHTRTLSLTYQKDPREATDATRGLNYASPPSTAAIAASAAASVAAASTARPKLPELPALDTPDMRLLMLRE